MLNIYLCDDNKIILEKYKALLIKTAQKHNFLIAFQLFTSGEQLLFYLEDKPEAADIIYMDIRMDGIDGLETAKKLRKFGSSAEIIFLTGNSEYVFDSFDVSPTHYILKDSISDARFEEIFFKAAARVEKKSQAVFSCEGGGMKKQILISEIVYFEIHNRMVTVHYRDQKFDFYSRLEDLEKHELLRHFIRVHRSYLVHLQYVEMLSKSTLVLITGENIPIGITYSKDVKMALSNYLNLFR